MERNETTYSQHLEHIPPTQHGGQQPNPELIKLLRAEELLGETHQLEESDLSSESVRPDVTAAHEPAREAETGAP